MKADALLDIMAVAGFASLVTGAAMVHVPSALIVAGVLLLCGSIASQLRREADAPKPADEEVA